MSTQRPVGQKRFDKNPSHYLSPDLSVRANNCLLNNGCKTIDDVAAFSEAEIFRSPNAGRMTLNEIRDWLHANGRKFEGTRKDRPAPVAEPEPTISSLYAQFEQLKRDRNSLIESVRTYQQEIDRLETVLQDMTRKLNLNERVGFLELKLQEHHYNL